MSQIISSGAAEELKLVNATTIEDLNAQLLLGCTRCSRFEIRESGSFKVSPSWGNPDGKLLICSESPSTRDAELGVPFSHGSGDKIKDMCRYVGLNPEQDVFWTNLVQCPALHDAEPTKSETDACSKYLKQVIRLSSFKAIWVFGNTAFTALTGRELKNEAGSDHSFPLVDAYITACDDNRLIKSGQSSMASITQDDREGHKIGSNSIPVWGFYHTAALFKHSIHTEKIKRTMLTTLEAFKKHQGREKPWADLGLQTTYRGLAWPTRLSKIEDLL